MISQKCRYALRAIFELFKRRNDGPTKNAEIAQAQAIPSRFLEVIMSQLKQGGFVESKRGAEGGYFLARSHNTLTVGQIIRFVEGPMGPVDCIVDNLKENCPLYGDCTFLPMWQKVGKAISDVYDNTTFQHLVEEENRKRAQYVPSYSI